MSWRKEVSEIIDQLIEANQVIQHEHQKLVSVIKSFKATVATNGEAELSCSNDVESSGSSAEKPTPGSEKQIKHQDDDDDDKEVLVLDLRKGDEVDQSEILYVAKKEDVRHLIEESKQRALSQKPLFEAVDCLYCGKTFTLESIKMSAIKGACRSCDSKFEECCAHCGCQFETLQLRAEHTKFWHKSFCFICQIQFQSYEQAENHILKCLAACPKMKSSIYTKTLFAATPSDLQLKCEKCTFVTNKVEAKLEHVKSVHKYVQCLICFGMCENSEVLRNHILGRHLNTPKCMVCQLSLGEVSERVRHSRRRHRDTCPLCQMDVCDGYKRHVTICAAQMPDSLKTQLQS